MESVALLKSTLEYPTRPTLDFVSTGLDALDRAIGGLKCQRLYLLKGDRHLDGLIYRCMVKNILLRGGQALFVDCGNSLDPYAIAKICRQSGIDADFILNNILVSRPFTAYQISSLLDGLPGALGERPVLVVFSRFLELFASADLEDGDADLLLPAVMQKLREIVGDSYPLLLTHAKGDKKHLALASEVADTIIDMAFASRHGIKARLEKDPAMSPESFEFYCADGGQATLEEYATGE